MGSFSLPLVLGGQEPGILIWFDAHKASYHSWLQRPSGRCLPSSQLAKPYRSAPHNTIDLLPSCSSSCCILHLDLWKVRHCTKDNSTNSINATVSIFQNENILVEHSEIVCGVCIFSYPVCIVSTYSLEKKDKNKKQTCFCWGRGVSTAVGPRMKGAYRHFKYDRLTHGLGFFKVGTAGLTYSESSLG